MSAWVWGVVLVAAVWAAHWGAERLAAPLKKLRRQWGLSEVAGAAFIGLAAASPEIGINTASALRQVPEIGLGASLGSNIIAIPLVVTIAYLASRRRKLGSSEAGAQGHPDHDRHREEHALRVQQEAVTVQAIPYLLLIVLFATLTVPPQWRGLQPIDGWILLGGYFIYLAQAVLRGRKEGEDVAWSGKEVALAVAGLASLIVGAYLTVRSTENIVAAVGISQIVGGLFIVAPMAALPELFAVWSVTHSGQVTSATTSVIGDHAVTMTVAFLPLALMTLNVQNFQLFWINLVFVALIPTVYAAFSLGHASARLRTLAGRGPGCHCTRLCRSFIDQRRPERRIMSPTLGGSHLASTTPSTWRCRSCDLVCIHLAVARYAEARTEPVG